MTKKLQAYSVFLPRHRLSRKELPNGGTGARAVAGYDEDVITMAVGAIRGLPKQHQAKDQVYLATATPPFADKSNAGVVNTACAGKLSAQCVDFSGLRSGVSALQIASQTGGVAVLSDMRTGRPGSVEEAEGGDGAVAFAFGDGDDPIAEIVGVVSRQIELMDVWRRPGANWSYVWEERFAASVMAPVIAGVADDLRSASGSNAPPTFALVSAMNGRFAASVAETLKPTRGTKVLKECRSQLGFCGAADPGVLIAFALDQAKAGDTIAVFGTGSGVDALLLRVLRDGPGTLKIDPGIGLQYVEYLSWRGLLDREPARRPDRPFVSAPASFRNHDWKYGLKGSRCLDCGKVHLPPQRICSGCNSVDRTEPYDASATAAHVASFSTDLVSDSPAQEAIAAMVDFDGGGRIMMELTEADPKNLGVGSPVELTFRRTYEAKGTPNYFWKARPVNRVST